MSESLTIRTSPPLPISFIASRYTRGLVFFNDFGNNQNAGMFMEMGMFLREITRLTIYRHLQIWGRINPERMAKGVDMPEAMKKKVYGYIMRLTSAELLKRHGDDWILTDKDNLQEYFKDFAPMTENVTESIRQSVKDKHKK